jgi:hypothetical protein
MYVSDSCSYGCTSFTLREKSPLHFDCENTCQLHEDEGNLNHNYVGNLYAKKRFEVFFTLSQVKNTLLARSVHPSIMSFSRDLAAIC